MARRGQSPFHSGCKKETVESVLRRNAKGIEVPVDNAVVDSFNCAANTCQLRFDGNKGFRVDQPGRRKPANASSAVSRSPLSRRAFA